MHCGREEKFTIRRKSLEIIRCSQCYNFATGAMSHWCMHPDVQEECMDDPETIFKYKVTKPGYIPEWCPLEDWPDE